MSTWRKDKDRGLVLGFVSNGSLQGKRIGIRQGLVLGFVSNGSLKGKRIGIRQGLVLGFVQMGHSKVKDWDQAGSGFRVCVKWAFPRLRIGDQWELSSS